jgi:hypothetical protein
MVVRERIMVYAVVDLAIWVSRPLSPELPYCPVGAMLAVEPVYERVERVAVSPLWVGATRTGGRDD